MKKPKEKTKELNEELEDTEEEEHDFPDGKNENNNELDDRDPLSLEEEEALLKKRLEQIEQHRTQTSFIKEAPKKIEELEKAVSKNRQYIVQLNKLVEGLRQQIEILIKEK